MRELVKFTFEWLPPSLNYPLNPLQGLSGMSFLINYWLIPSTVISYLFNGINPNIVIINFISSLQLFCSIWFLAKSIKSRKEVCILAAWLGSVCILPFIVPGHKSFISFYPISGIIPYITDQISVTNFALGLLFIFKFKLDIKNLFISTVFLLLIIYIISAFTLMSILSLTPLLIFLLLKSYKEIIILKNYKSLLAVLIFFIIVIYPIFNLLSLLIYSVPTFFSNELMFGRPKVEFISTLFHGAVGYGWGSAGLYMLSVFWIFNNNFKNNHTVFKIENTYLYILFSILTLGIITSFIFKNYRGPSMMYFEWCLWGLMFVYSSEQIFKITDALNTKIRFLNKYTSLLSSSVLVPFVLVLIVCIFNRPNRELPFEMPPARTEIIDKLIVNVSLTPGSLFSGRVATISNSIDPSVGANWSKINDRDNKIWMNSGNDMRGTGLWWFNIPTLFSYNQLMSPFYYYIVTRLFSNPNDKQVRSVVVLTKPNLSLLGMLGVRYVITDQVLNSSSDDQYLTSPVSSNQNIVISNVLVENFKNPYLYEIKNVNLGDFSPTEVSMVSNAKDAIMHMSREDFNPQKTLVIYGDDSLSKYELVEARNAELLYWKDHIKIKAKSKGTSILLLPIEYSNTLSIKNNAFDSKIRLFRANIGLTGVLFDNDLNIELHQDLSPFSGLFLKIKDYIDAKNSKF